MLSIAWLGYSARGRWLVYVTRSALEGIATPEGAT